MGRTKAVKQSNKVIEKTSVVANKSAKSLLGLAKAAAGLIAIRQVGIFLNQASIASENFNISMRALSQQAEQVNIDAIQLVESLRDVTKGQVSLRDLTAASNRAIALLGKDAIPRFEELADIALKASQVMGTNVTQAFGDIVTGIGRQSRMILDNLGIIVDSTKAYEDYAKELGKTADELTDNERKMAFLNAAIEQGKAKFSSLNVTLSARQGLNASFEDLKVKIGNVINPPLAKLLNQISELIDNFNKLNPEAQKFKVTLGLIGTGALIVGPSIISMASDIATLRAVIVGGGGAAAAGVAGGISAGVAAGVIGALIALGVAFNEMRKISRKGLISDNSLQDLKELTEELKKNNLEATKFAEIRGKSILKIQKRGTEGGFPEVDIRGGRFIFGGEDATPIINKNAESIIKLRERTDELRKTLKELRDPEILALIRESQNLEKQISGILNPAVKKTKKEFVSWFQTINKFFSDKTADKLLGFFDELPGKIKDAAREFKFIKKEVSGFDDVLSNLIIRIVEFSEVVDKSPFAQGFEAGEFIKKLFARETGREFTFANIKEELFKFLFGGDDEEKTIDIGQQLNDVFLKSIQSLTQSIQTGDISGAIQNTFNAIGNIISQEISRLATQANLGGKTGEEVTFGGQLLGGLLGGAAGLGVGLLGVLLGGGFNRTVPIITKPVDVRLVEITGNAASKLLGVSQRQLIAATAGFNRGADARQQLRVLD